MIVVTSYNFGVAEVGSLLSQLLSGLNVIKGAVSAQMSFRSDARGALPNDMRYAECDGWTYLA